MTIPEEEDSPAAMPSAGGQPPVAALSPWLQLMLAEIARKREELERARREQARRELERAPAAATTAENLPTR
jgi:hypothetical protein